MCGIVGYAGGRPALGIVLDGLRRLEYRGYDSAGVAVVAGGALSTEKRAGKLANLEKVLAESARPGIGDGTTGIGHTRWATHGGPTDRNAHPHLSADARTPGAVVGARRNSPLVVGRGSGGNFLASDVSAFIEHTRQAIELGQDQVVLITADDVSITDFAGQPATGRDFHIDWDASAAEKGGYDYFMLKEIAEQPRAVADTLLGRLTETGDIMLDEVRLTDQDLRDIDKVFIVACGTAYHAGLVTKYAIEHWTRIPCEVELASEFRYRDPVLDRSTLVVAISQSGETMDTLMALRHAKEQKARVLAICNTNGATIPRESDAVLYTHGGPEIAVASTKAFLPQLVACYLVGLHLAQVRGVIYADGA